MDIHFMGIDSLYLTVTKGDLSGWYHVYAAELSPDVTFKELKEGIPNRKFGYMLRSGAHGYKLSLWDGDMRIYFSPDKRMGIWVQFGPKWLRKWEQRYTETGLSLYDAVLQALSRYMGDLSAYEIRLNRLDWAADVEFDLSTMSVDQWIKGWVGYAGFYRSFSGEEIGEAPEQAPSNVSSVYGSRELETVYIGRSKSDVKFRAYDKIKQAAKEGDIDWWREVWANHNGGKKLPEDVKITRLEWETKPHWAAFKNFTLLEHLTFENLAALQSYLISWGRLTVPNADPNRSRWPLHEFWSAAVEAIETEIEILPDRLTRHPITAQPTISDQYVNQTVGVITGAMARIGLKGFMVYSLRNLSGYLESRGYEPRRMLSIAVDKYHRYRILWSGSGAV